jgi:hypothetical protein
MTHVSGRSTWRGLVTFIGAVVCVGHTGNAVAKIHKWHKWHRHAYRSIYESRAQVAPQQPSRLGPSPGPMRYYGGPKSPMWRGPVEN